MKKNYAAWEIDPQEFSQCTTEKERLLFLLRFGILAPSSHNSQPWQFSVNDEDGIITILPCEARKLPESDTRMRQLYISLGCAAQNIVLAAEYFGYSAVVTYPSDQNPAVTLTISKTISQEKPPVETLPVTAILNRRTDRSPYATEPVSPFELPPRLRENNGVFVNYVSDRLKMDLIADATLDAIDDAMGQKSFARELSHYIIHNYSSSPTGMPGNTVGIPTPLSFVIPFLIRNAPAPKSQRIQNEKLLKNGTPTYVVISTLGDTPEDWVKAGEAFEYIALRASLDGVATHPMAAGVEIGKYHERIQSALGLTTRPQFFMRIGKTTHQADPSPRLPLTSVVS